MIDYEENPENTLFILEGDLQNSISYFHGRLPQHKCTETVTSAKEKGDGSKGAQNLRDHHCSKAVSIIHGKRDPWIEFYAAKCGIKYEDLCAKSNVDIHFRMEVLKTKFVWFLLEVDILSTIYVKEKPTVSQGKILKTKNSDFLKYAIKKYRSICKTFWQE
jgi:hypothetical protein